MVNRCHFLTLALLLTNSLVFAGDLGVYGQTYPIAEDDLLNYIESRIHEMQLSGEWTRVENKFRENSAKHVERPQAVEGLGKAVQNISWYYDPSITAPADLRDANGHVIVYAGTTINPLKMVRIHRPMVFFDADDQEQVNWARQICQREENQVKLVLVNGSIPDMLKVFKQPVYFDQAGRLTSRFHIHHVPAIVQQTGLNLKVSEVVP